MINNKLGQKVKFCILVYVLKLHLHTNKMFKTAAQRERRRTYHITEHVSLQWCGFFSLSDVAGSQACGAEGVAAALKTLCRAGARTWAVVVAAPPCLLPSLLRSCVLDPQASEQELLTAWEAPAMILSERPSWIRFWSCISIGMQTTSSNTNPPQVKLEMLVGKGPRRSFMWAHWLSLTHKRSWGRNALTKQNSEL